MTSTRKRTATVALLALLTFAGGFAVGVEHADTNPEPRRAQIVTHPIDLDHRADELAPTSTSRPAPRWACAAEDEVVIIGDRCVHIDTLAQP